MSSVTSALPDSVMKPITAIDTRYSRQVQEIGDVFSDFVYYKYRYMIICRMFNILSSVKYGKSHHNMIFCEFDQNAYDSIHMMEEKTKHDVKAIVDHVAELVNIDSGNNYDSGLVHVGFTSQDVNSPAFVLMFRDLCNLMLGKIRTLADALRELAERSDIVMLSFTHGQSAVPTTMKKELFIYVYRITHHIDIINDLVSKLRCKIGGANGNNNALRFIAPGTDWITIFNKLASELGLTRTPLTTQCDDYDSVASVLGEFRNMCNILEALRMNVWNYLSSPVGYFKMSVSAGQVGSSTMSHKINPIEFENSRTMLTCAKAGLIAISDIITTLEYQRDVSDSSATRLISTHFAEMLLAVKGLTDGVNKLSVNTKRITADLNYHPEVLVEAVQCYLRWHCDMKDAYEQIKEISQGKEDFSLEDLHLYIDKLTIDEKHKEKLKALTPSNYI